MGTKFYVIEFLLFVFREKYIIITKKIKLENVIQIWYV